MQDEAIHDAEPLGWITKAQDADIAQGLTELKEQELREWRWHWGLKARAAQLPPPGDWRVWLLLAGRGFGKTRTGAEWANAVAERDPEARIALVAANLGEARAIMVEGESGIMGVMAPHRRPAFEPSLRRLVWPNGAQAQLYSAAEPESLRGPQHSHARRAKPEGNDRQRSDRDGGHPAQPRDRSNRIQPSRRASGGQGMDRRHGP